MIKYKKLFGTIRILLGIIFLIYPAYEFLNQQGFQSEESARWLFVFIFFLLYAYSAINNGIKEIGGNPPAFNLVRFFEAAMNGFVSLYLIIIIIAANINANGKFLLVLLALLTLISMVRDLRIISLQYYEKKQKLKK